MTKQLNEVNEEPINRLLRKFNSNFNETSLFLKKSSREVEAEEDHKRITTLFSRFCVCVKVTGQQK